MRHAWRWWDSSPQSLAPRADALSTGQRRQLRSAWARHPAAAKQERRRKEAFPAAWVLSGAATQQPRDDCPQSDKALEGTLMRKINIIAHAARKDVGSEDRTRDLRIMGPTRCQLRCTRLMAHCFDDTYGRDDIAYEVNNLTLWPAELRKLASFSEICACWAASSASLRAQHESCSSEP